MGMVGGGSTLHVGRIDVEGCVGRSGVGKGEVVGAWSIVVAGGENVGGCVGRIGVYIFQERVGVEMGHAGGCVRGTGVRERWMGGRCRVSRSCWRCGRLHVCGPLWYWKRHGGQYGVEARRQRHGRWRLC